MRTDHRYENQKSVRPTVYWSTVYQPVGYDIHTEMQNIDLYILIPGKQ